jgi:hypothetical protein
VKPVLRTVIDSSSNFAPVAGKCIGGSGFPRLRKLIESTTYKPGYELVLVVGEPSTINGVSLFGPEEYAKLLIKAYLPNSRQFPYDATPIEFQFSVSSYIEDMPEETMCHWLQTVVRQFEMHESDEWLQVGGELVNDPHATQDGR